MDKHLQIQKQIAIYDDLSQGEQKQVDDHLSMCPSCQTYWQACQRMDRQLADLPDVQPLPQLRADFQVRLTTEIEHNRRPFRLKQFPALVAQTAVLALVVLLFTSVILSIRNQSTPLVQPIAAPPRASSTPTQTPTAISTVTPMPTPTATAAPVWGITQQQVMQDGRSRVNDLALSADGTTFVTAHEDRRIKRWQIDDVVPKDSWRLANRAANSVAISSDGSQIAAGSRDYQGYVTLWQAGVQYEDQVLQGHDDSVTAVTFSTDGDWLASGTGGGEGKVRLWQSRSGTLTQTLNGYGAINALAFSTDGNLLAGAVDDGTTHIWQISNGILQQRLQPDNTAVTALTFSPDDQLLVTGHANGRIRIWQLADGDLLYELAMDTAVVHAVTISSDGTLLAAANANGTVSIWQLGEDAPTLLMAADTIDSQTDAMQLRFVPDGLMAVIGLADGTVEIWLANLQ